jgi:hypothetical protein
MTMPGLILSDCSRLAAEAMDQLCRALGSPKVAGAAAADSRLSHKALASILNAYGISPGRGVTTAASAARAYIVDPDRFERICGLVVYGTIIRTSVDAQAYRRLVRIFGAEDLAIACRIQESNAIRVDNGVDMDRLSELVEHAGRNALLCWYQGVPEEVAAELRISSVSLRLSGPVRGGRADVALSTRIVEAVAAELAAAERA